MEKKSELSFKLLDNRNKSTIRYERVNEQTGEPVPWENIVKGYEYSKNNYVVLEDDDFKRAAVEATQLIEIQNFVSADQIADEYFEKPYMLVPQKKAEKGYVLLREILKETGRVGIAKVVIRTREYLAAMSPREDGLVLLLLRWSEELRPIKEFELPQEEPSKYKVSDREIELAKQLVEAQTVDWEPEQYKDEYRDRLMEWIEKKAELGDMASVEPMDDTDVEAATNVIDLVDLLRQSVQASSGKKTDKKEDDEEESDKKPRKSTKRKQA